MFRWFVINTYSGHENKVKQNLEHRVQTMSQQGHVRHVVGCHDADELDVRVSGQRAEGGDGKVTAAQEDSADRPLRHARALCASRTSASSSFPCPTAMSSSIESR